MPTTPTYSLPYPASGDPPNGPTQIRALAEAVETQVARLDATPQPAQAESATTISSITSTTYAAGSPVVGVSVVAPPSGKVCVTVSGMLNQSVNGQSTRLSWELRTGATIGSGTVLQAATPTRCIAAGLAVNTGGGAQASGSHRYLVDSLTPGSSYNVRAMHAVTGGSGQIVHRVILVEPVR